MGIDKALTVAGMALALAGTLFFVGALALGMALERDVGAGDAVCFAVAALAGAVALGMAGAVGSLLVAVLRDHA